MLSFLLGYIVASTIVIGWALGRILGKLNSYEKKMDALIAACYEEIKAQRENHVIT